MQENPSVPVIGGRLPVPSEFQLRPTAQRGEEFNFSIRENPPSVWPAFLVGQPDKPVRVLVADKDPPMRRIIIDEIAEDPRTVLVAQADSLKEGRELVRRNDFDVMLVDLNLGDGSGYELVDYAKKLRGAAEVVVISVLGGDDDALRAFGLGAAGFLVKNSGFGSFVQAILQVVNGGAAISPSLARRLLHRLDRRDAEGSRPCASVPVRLSEREREVLRMIANGLTSAKIGMHLTISAMTVNTHVKSIYHKLHVRSRAQAVSCASTWGIL